MKSRTVMVQVVHDSKALLFEMGGSTSLDILQRKLRDMFKIKVNESFDIYWIDDDNDRIILDSDEVLKIVLKTFQKQNIPSPMMKLNIQKGAPVKVLGLVDYDELCRSSPIIKQKSNFRSHM